MNKSAGVEANKMKMSGVNSAEQDEFTQVQGVVGHKNSEVKDAMNKVASVQEQLDELKQTAKREGNMTKYASLFDHLESELRIASDMARKALKENPESILNENKEPTKDKPYGAYDKSSEAVNAETQSSETGWKSDSHDELGLGIPKKDSEIPRIAAQRLAANKAVKIAMSLLGDRCPEDVIASQGRDFFNGMSMTAMDNTIRRIEETASLYDATGMEAPAMAPEAPAPEATPAPVEAAPAPATAPVASADESACPFTKEEEVQIEKEASRIASERKSRILQAAQKKANDMMMNAEVAPTAPEAVPAPEVAPAPVPETPVAEATPEDAEQFGLGEKGEADAGDPELSKLFDDESTEAVQATASRTASYKGKLPKLGAGSSTEDLQSMWNEEDFNG